MEKNAKNLFTFFFALLGFLALLIQRFTGAALYFHAALFAFIQCGALLILDEVRAFHVWLHDDGADPFKTRLNRVRTALLWPPALVLWLAFTFFFLSVDGSPSRLDLAWTAPGGALIVALGLFVARQYWLITAPDCKDKKLISVFLAFDTVLFTLLALELALLVWRGLSAFELTRWGLFALWLLGGAQFLLGLFTFDRSLERDCPYEITLSLRPSASLTPLEHLKKHTGLSAHSLWSVGYLRKTLPLAFLGLAFVLWYATSFVQVGPGQQAAVYRLGRLTPKNILGEGLHLLWPRPFDRAVVVDTAALRASTLGYEPDDSQDFLWARSHSAAEYKLPTGGGKELVSVNLKIYWHVADLYQFLTTFAQPEEQLKARGYHWLLEQTQNNQLDSLLGAERRHFTESLTTELRKWATEAKSGLAVDNVVMESLHPPVEIASVYQSAVSARTVKETARLKAQGEAAAQVALARGEAAGTLSAAQATAAEKRGAAQADAELFNAQVQAQNAAGQDSYRFTKRMTTLEETLPGRKIYILGKGVNPSSLFINSQGIGELPTQVYDDENPAWGKEFTSPGQPGDQNAETATPPEAAQPTDQPQPQPQPDNKENGQ